MRAAALLAGAALGATLLPAASALAQGYGQPYPLNQYPQQPPAYQQPYQPYQQPSYPAPLPAPVPPQAPLPPAPPSSASGEVQSREAIALQNQLLELRRDLQALQSQRAPGYGGRAPSPSGAGGDLLPQLLDRVSALEEETRRLRGRVDDLQNQVQQQQRDFSKQLGDLQFRLQGGGAPPAAPVPSAPSTLPDQDTRPPPSGREGDAAPSLQATPRRTPELAMQEGNAALARRDYPAAEAAAREVLGAGRTGARSGDAQLLLAQALTGKRRLPRRRSRLRRRLPAPERRCARTGRPARPRQHAQQHRREAGRVRRARPVAHGLSLRPAATSVTPPRRRVAEPGALKLATAVTEAAPVGAAEFEALMRPLGPFAPDRRVAVAVSGGADSMALALLAAGWGRAQAFVVDHRLRPASTAEAALTMERLAGLGVPARLLTLSGLRRGPALHARARAARYEALLRRLRRGGACRPAARPSPRGPGRDGRDARRAGQRCRGPRRHGGRDRARDGAALAPAAPGAAGAVSGRRSGKPASAGSRTPPTATRQRTAPGSAPARLSMRRRGRRTAPPANGRRRRSRRRSARPRRSIPRATRPWRAPTSPSRCSRPWLWTLSGQDYPPSPGAVARAVAAGRATSLHGVLLRRWRDGWLLAREPAATAAAVEAIPGAIWDGRFRVLPGAALPARLQLGASGRAGRCALARPFAAALRGPARIARAAPRWSAGRRAAPSVSLAGAMRAGSDRLLSETSSRGRAVHPGLGRTDAVSRELAGMHTLLALPMLEVSIEPGCARCEDGTG